ncbi:30S ribosomal protein S2 [bacterium]|nr:30S ribosomal protein S2 [bacterium]
MLNLTMEQLLEAGVHFGHQKSRWNPKMRPFIFGVRNGVHIIDLRKTLKQLQQAYNIIRNYSSKGSLILFVGTKKQIKDIIAEEAQRANIFWVSERWLGGTLTNFRTIRQSVQRLRQIEKMFEDDTVKQLTKKEANILDTKRAKLNKVLSGIRDMERIPDVMFVIDVIQEKTAVAEAKKLGIYVMGIVDTNCDPDIVDFAIPGNDDAIKSVRILTSTIADAVLDGKSGGQLGSSFTQKEPEAAQGKTVESAGDTSEKIEQTEKSDGNENQTENPEQPAEVTPTQQENE